MQEIPEEIQAMAWLVGQSQQIDSMMTERNKELITDARTIKQGLNDYVQLSRQQEMQQNPAAFVPPPQYIPPPQYVPQPIPQPPYFPPPAAREDDGQLEFNLDPKVTDVIVNLLEEISRKLTKQNSLLQSIYANQSSQEGSPNSSTKSGKAE